MTNLLKETLRDIETAGKDVAQITYIGSVSGDYSCTVAEFLVLANVEYDSGYGGQEVASDLIIKFRDGSWMERGEYDGSEWWNYQTSPEVSEVAETKTITRLTGGSWVSLAEMHSNDDDQD